MYRGVVLVFVLLTLIAAMVIGKWLSRPDSPPIVEVSQVRQPIVRPTEGFVGSDACRECHRQEHQSWHASYHRTMTQPASPETMLAPIDDVHLASRGRTYHLTHEDDGYWVDMADPDWEVALEMQGVDLATIRDPPRIKREIVMLTGSHHYQALWIRGRDGNALRQIPFVYYFADELWIPREDAFLHHPDDRRAFAVWNTNCIQCHAVAGAPGIGKANRTIHSQVVELGIACESCHGPGEEHVRRYSSAANTGEKFADPAIVHPGKLSPQRSAEVCGQCHAYFVPNNMDDWWENGYRGFRPGDNLAASRNIIRPANSRQRGNVRGIFEPTSGPHDLYWPDGGVRVGGREYLGMVESACHTQGGMTCLSCHSMHAYDSPADQLAVGLDGNQACLQCHDSFRHRLEEHTQHPASSSGSLCYNCHMPHTTYALFKGIRNHHIINPHVAPTIALHQPTACNLCHLDRTRDWTARHIAEWYGHQPQNVEPDGRQVADSVLLALRGDAAQRAIVTWALGWGPAQEASGTDWMIPVLAELLNDPYSVIRLMALRSLHTLPGYEDWEFDFLAPAERRQQDIVALLRQWKRLPAANLRDSDGTLLIDGDGSLLRSEFDRLLDARDQRPVSISE